VVGNVGCCFATRDGGAPENAARAALDSAAGRTLTDPEWEQTQSKLVEFVSILRSWDRKAQKVSAGLGNVEALCQQET
jgi:hypothetical protein